MCIGVRVCGILQSVENVLNAFAQTDVILSPNEQLIVTPTAADRNKPELGGRLNFYNRRTLELVESLRLSDSSLVRVVWNGNINQVYPLSSSSFLVSVSNGPSILITLEFLFHDDRRSLRSL